MVIGPLNARGHRHEDALGAPTRLQTKKGAAVPDQIEFDITAAPKGLPLALALAVCVVAAALCNRQPGFDKTVTHGLGQGKCGGEIRFGEIIKKDATDTAGLTPMFQEKIIIAPSLEARVGFRAKGLECVCTGSMEVGGITSKP